MFTGIVEEVGRITRIAQQGENRRITISAKNTPRELRTGDSVSVSGVCLTSLDIKPDCFCADLAPETCQNLERAGRSCFRPLATRPQL